MKNLLLPLFLLSLVGCTGKFEPIKPDTITDPTELGNRMNQVNQEVSMIVVDPLVTNVPKFTHISTIDAPTITTMSGVKQLKATATLKLDNFLYIAYNYDGPEVYGGLDIVNIQHLAAPVLVASIRSSTYEFNDIKARGRALYLAGNKKDVGAAVVIMDIANTLAPIIVNELLVPGDVATSLDIRNGEMQISSGLNGGISRYEVAWTDVLTPSFIRYNPFPNALFVKTMFDPYNPGLNKPEPLILGGASDTHLYWMDKELPLNAASNVAPSRLVVSGPMAYMNMTNGGLKVTDISKLYDGRGFEGFVSTLNLPGQGTGIAHMDQKLYVARGGAGVRYVNVDEPGAPTEIGYLAFNDLTSVNNVWIERYAWTFKVLTVVDGEGGVRLVVEDTAQLKYPGSWIQIYAKGTPLASVNPLMEVSVNGVVVATNISVASETWKIYHVNLPSEVPFGADVRIRFYNDAYLPGIDDRNLSIGYVKIGDDYYYPWWNNLLDMSGNPMFPVDSDNLQMFSNGYMKILR